MMQPSVPLNIASQQSIKPQSSQAQAVKDSVSPSTVSNPSGIGSTQKTVPSAMAVRNHDYVGLIAKLRASRRDTRSLNSLGVCHLRTGDAAEAVRIFRGLVLQPGCTWERADVPLHYRRNFATALLMAGYPSGCRDVSRALPDQTHPRTRELLAAIANWQRSLGFWRRWDWRLNAIEPPNCVVPINFVPGEFDDDRF